MKSARRTAALHYQRGEYHEAEAVCRDALAQHPESAHLWYLRGLSAMGLKNYDSAIDYLETAAESTDIRPEVLVNLGAAMVSAGRLEDAVRTLSDAVALTPMSADAWQNLAAANFRLERLDDAASAVSRTLDLRPEEVKTVELAVQIYLKNDDLEKAEALTDIALRLGLYRIAGDIALRKRDFSVALERYNEAAKDPNQVPDVMANRALALIRDGSLHEGIEQLRKVVALDPDEPNARFSLGTALLTLGQFDEGWPLYTARHFHKDMRGVPVARPMPTALPRMNERFIGVLDQGVGDQIMHASLLRDLLDLYAAATIYCDRRLIPLFSRSFPSAEFCEHAPDAPTPGSISVIDTARWLRTGFDTFPRHQGYLRANPELKQALRNTYLQKGNKLLVGISWSTSTAIKFAKEKTIDLAQWGPILSLPGITFVNLQYGESHEEAERAAQTFGTQIVSDLNFDSVISLDTFAAQVASLDLIITTSNSTAHFAGAQNVPTWVLVPRGYGGIWHWFADRVDSPWYPSVRLFRQTRREDWEVPIGQVSEALSELLVARQPG